MKILTYHFMLTHTDTIYETYVILFSSALSTNEYCSESDEDLLCASDLICVMYTRQGQVCSGYIQFILIEMLFWWGRRYVFLINGSNQSDTTMV